MGTGWTSVGWRAQTGRGCASVCVGAHVGGDESGCIECEYLSDSVSDRCTGSMWLSLPCTDLAISKAIGLILVSSYIYILIGAKLSNYTLSQEKNGIHIRNQPQYVTKQTHRWTVAKKKKVDVSSLTVRNVPLTMGSGKVRQAT